MIAELLITATVTRTLLATSTRTKTPTPRTQFVYETTHVDNSHRPYPTPDAIEIDDQHTPFAFTPRRTVKPASDYDACGWCPNRLRTLTPITGPLGTAIRRHYADGTVGAVAVMVTMGPAPTGTRVPTFTKTQPGGFTRTATVTPGGPTPTQGPGDQCILFGVTCTPTPRISATRTPAPTVTPTPVPARFMVNVQWQKNDGTSGIGHAVPFLSGIGYWFFTSDNPELFVALKNGCPVNGQWWLFAAGLTNVGVTITVKDNQTGLTKTYQNPVDNPFTPIQDTALEVCQ